MSITQERLYNVVMAAQQFMDLHDFLIQAVHQACRRVQSGEATSGQALSDLAIRVDIIAGVEERTLINVEKVRWKLTQSKNNSEKERKRRRRGYYENVRMAPGQGYGPSRFIETEADALMRRIGTSEFPRDKDGNQVRPGEAAEAPPKDFQPLSSTHKGQARSAEEVAAALEAEENAELLGENPGEDDDPLAGL